MQEQCGGRTSLHLAVDLQNPPLVRCLLGLGANVNCFNYGGFTPYHLTYGRQSEEIRCELYEKTPQELRELPDSESDGSDMEDLDTSEDEVCTQVTADPEHPNGALGDGFLTFAPFFPAAVRRHKVREVDDGTALSRLSEQAEKLLKGCPATAPHEGKASGPAPRSEPSALQMETAPVWSKVTLACTEEAIVQQEPFNIVYRYILMCIYQARVSYCKYRDLLFLYFKSYYLENQE